MINSPLTKSNKVSLVKNISTSLIVDLYAKMGVPVQHYFENLKSISIYRCDESGLLFYSPSTIAGDARFYELLDKVAANYYSSWKWEHDVVLRYVQPGSKVLEIGAAYGTFLKRSLEVGAQLAIGLELNENAIKAAKIGGLDIRNELIEEHCLSHENAYDLVTSFQVVEHINDVNSFISSSLKCLKKNGIMAISVPNNDCYFFKNDPNHTLNLPPHHMGLWAEGSLRNLGDYFGLSVLGVYKQPASFQNYGTYYMVFLQNKLKLKGKFLTLTYKLTKSVAKVLMLVSPPKFGACITVVYQKL